MDPFMVSRLMSTGNNCFTTLKSKLIFEILIFDAAYSQQEGHLNLLVKGDKNAQPMSRNSRGTIQLL